MKYLNKKLIHTMDFYNALSVLDLNYNEFIDAYKKTKDFVKSLFIQNEKELPFADEIRTILFDIDDEKISLNEYKQLQRYAKSCKQFFDCAFDVVVASKNKLEKNANKKIAQIANYWRLHEAEIRSIAVSEQNEVNFIIWHDSIYNMKFQNMTDLKMEEIENCIGGSVLYTELFENSDGSFEYNFLILKSIVSHIYESEYFEMNFVFRDIDLDVITIEYPEEYI